MNQQTKNRYVAVTRQVDSMRRLYSNIGQPLPADVIIDLHHHLGKALALAEQTKPVPHHKPAKTNIM